MRRSMMTLAALLLAAPAFGATLDSAPALGAFSDAQLNCLIRNVSTTTRMVKVQVLNYAGTVIYSTNQEVLPGQMRFVTTNEDSMPLAASCRFVVSGSAKYYRASTMYSGDDGIEMVIPAE
jgi:hypothetical protein